MECLHVILLLVSAILLSVSDGKVGRKSGVLPSNTTKTLVSPTHTPKLIVVNQTNQTTNFKMHTPASGSISGMALRAFYVIIAVSSLVIVYFVMRAVCSRKRRQNTRRYGILRADKQDQMEMHPLSEVEDDDDDDDMTLFDINDQKRKSKSKR